MRPLKVSVASCPQTHCAECLTGHRYLFENGVLHRDISAGNILLAFDSDTTKPGSEGFITDLDYAHIERNSPLMSKRVEQALVPAAERTVLYKHAIFEKRTVEPDAHITARTSLIYRVTYAS